MEVGKTWSLPLRSRGVNTDIKEQKAGKYSRGQSDLGLSR